MVLDGMGWDRPTEWAVAATERTQTESSTLANPGRTSLHSQPETHITQVVRPEWEKCVRGKGKGKRDQAMGLTRDVSIGRRIREAAHSFPPKLKCKGDVMVEQDLERGVGIGERWIGRQRWLSLS